MPENVYLALGSWIIITLATERTTEIINDSKFFFPLRNWLAAHALSNSPHTAFKSCVVFLYTVISCAWCLSVWVSLFFCWFLPGEYFVAAATHNILVKWLALVGMANLWHEIFQRAITLGVNNGVFEIKHTVEMVDADPRGDEMTGLGIVIGGDDGKYPESDEQAKDSSAAG